MGPTNKNNCAFLHKFHLLIDGSRFVTAEIFIYRLYQNHGQTLELYSFHAKFLHPYYAFFFLLNTIAAFVCKSALKRTSYLFSPSFTISRPVLGGIEPRFSAYITSFTESISGVMKIVLLFACVVSPALAKVTLP